MSETYLQSVLTSMPCCPSLNVALASFESARAEPRSGFAGSGGRRYSPTSMTAFPSIMAVRVIVANPEALTVKLNCPAGIVRSTYAPVASEVARRPDAAPNVMVTTAPLTGLPVALFVIFPERTYADVTVAAVTEALSWPASSVKSTSICTLVARDAGEPVTVRSDTDNVPPARTCAAGARSGPNVALRPFGNVRSIAFMVAPAFPVNSRSEKLTWYASVSAPTNSRIAVTDSTATAAELPPGPLFPEGDVGDEPAPQPIAHAVVATRSMTLMVRKACITALTS
jgi:hypothetical protein